MKFILSSILCLLSVLSFSQNWEALNYNQDQPSLELNPLKGLTPLYDVSNTFPHSIRGKIVGFDAIMKGFDPSEFDWSVFDEFIEEVGDQGKFVKLQVNVDMGFNRSDLPQFLKDAGVGHAYYDGQGSGDNQGVPSVVVDYNNEEMMRALEIFIAEFGKKYNNDPRVFMIHYGLYGIFGEWGLGTGKILVPEGEDWAMSIDNQRRITEAYENAFTNKKLLARFPENVPNPQSVGYSDGLYFSGSISDEEQYNWFFHSRLLRSNTDLNWKNHPIGGEVDPHIQSTLWSNFPNTLTGDPDMIGVNPPEQNTDEVFNLTRPTFIFQDWIFNKENITQTSDPSMWENALKATKKTGYTFHIDKFKITAKENKPALEVNIVNKGLAPMYANWTIEFAYLDTSGNIVSLGTSSTWNLSVIQPDVANNYRSIISEVSMPSGTHTFLLKIINPLESYSDDAQPVRFANTNQDKDKSGWLTLGEASLAGGNLGQIPKQVSNMYLIPSSASIGLNENFQMKAQVFPGIATNRSVTWVSDKPGTASVDENGMVTSYNQAGEVKITGYTQDGAIESTSNLTVNAYWQLPTLVEAEGYSEINNARLGSSSEGTVLGFIGDDTWMDYRVKVNESAQYTIELRASSPYGVGKVALVNEVGDTLTKLNLSPGTDNSYDIYKTYKSDQFALPAGEYKLRLDVIKSAININWLEFKTECSDSDADGICDSDDNCPVLNDALIGTPCDDNNECTVGDVYTSNCNCEGNILDSDGDGVCDALDACPEFDDALVGTECNDLNEDTINDLWTTNCTCEGEIDNNPFQFTLIDSDTDKEISNISNGELLNIAEVGWNLNIKATTDLPAKSLQFDLNEDVNFRTENVIPYALAGDRNGDFFNWNPNIGTYELTVTAYSKKNRKGQILGTTTINFEVYFEEIINESFPLQLINSNTNELIRVLNNDDTIDLNELDSDFNILANYNNASSVRFSVNNDSDFRTESTAPYALAGDNNGDFFNWNPNIGTYYIKAIAYSQNWGQGELLGTTFIRLNVINSANTITTTTNRNSFKNDFETTSELAVTPNPFLNELNIQINNISRDKGSIIITDLMGKTIYTQIVNDYNVSSLKIDTNNFQSGVYIINYVQGMNSSIKKIIKQ